MTPKARTHQLLRQEVGAELVVYDQERHEAFCLNRTALLVWQHCDGRTTIPQLVQILREQLDPSADEELVWAALQQLDQRQLLEEPLKITGSHAGRSRHGALALLAPVVEFLLVPEAAAAYSW